MKKNNIMKFVKSYIAAWKKYGTKYMMVDLYVTIEKAAKKLFGLYHEPTNIILDEEVSAEEVPADILAKASDAVYAEEVSAEELAELEKMFG